MTPEQGKSFQRDIPTDVEILLFKPCISAILYRVLIYSDHVCQLVH